MIPHITHKDTRFSVCVCVCVYNVPQLKDEWRKRPMAMAVQVQLNETHEQRVSKKYAVIY